MARQVLENGVILPAEYSDDWYDDMTSNLTKLDDVIGSDSEKLSSADVGAAALSNNYNDLDNLPTIPTKTSDITNDSNFVDTSNAAVASGITSAKVTSYDSHIADNDIHVTTADKTSWNTVTSKANDSDVVHKSGNETIAGDKTFSSINGVEPSSLSLPDLSNGIDISSYITHLDKLVNSYTPSVNGYIHIRVRKTSLPIVSIRIQQNFGLMTSCETSDYSTWGTYLPVEAGKVVEFYISADSLSSAIFFPCQGNV